MVRPLEAELDRDLTRDQVDQRAGDKERRHAAWALLFNQQSGFCDRVQAANTRTNHHAGPFKRIYIFRHPVGIFDSHLRSSQTKQDKFVNLAAILGGHPVVGIEGPVGAIAIRHFTRVFRGDVRGIELRDWPRPGLSVQNPRPGFLYATGQRSNHS